jgi:hypothetical protein
MSTRASKKTYVSGGQNHDLQDCKHISTLVQLATSQLSSYSPRRPRHCTGLIARRTSTPFVQGTNMSESRAPCMVDEVVDASSNVFTTGNLPFVGVTSGRVTSCACLHVVGVCRPRVGGLTFCVLSPPPPVVVGPTSTQPPKRGRGSKPQFREESSGIATYLLQRCGVVIEAGIYHVSFIVSWHSPKSKPADRPRAGSDHIVALVLALNPTTSFPDRLTSSNHTAPSQFPRTVRYVPTTHNACVPIVPGSSTRAPVDLVPARHDTT